MYQVLHDTNNATDSGCHCVSADHSSRDVALLAVAVLIHVQKCSLLLGPVFEIKAATSKSGNVVVASVICAV